MCIVLQKGELLRVSWTSWLIIVENDVLTDLDWIFFWHVFKTNFPCIPKPNETKLIALVVGRDAKNWNFNENIWSLI